jgi:ArsR family transcriptional regulator
MPSRPERNATPSGSRELSAEALDLIAARFRLLSEPMRLRILAALGDREMTVGELVEALGAGQPNISKHLALMLDAGVLRRRKKGLCAYYSIGDATIYRLCKLGC